LNRIFIAMIVRSVASKLYDFSNSYSLSYQVIW